ncbi:MAG: PEP-CTERM sorting domain-containing protein [Cyanobacteria bacterium J06638_20]
MKYLAIAAAAAAGSLAIVAPANAALFSYDISYTGFFESEGGGSILGSILAPTGAADDGFIAIDEIDSWSWDWTGNSFVSPFSISSDDAGAEIQFGDGFDVAGGSNLPEDGDDQGTFVGGMEGEFLLDLEFLIVEDNTTAFPFGGDSTFGDAFATAASVSVSDPTVIPEPATVLGLLALAGMGATLKRKQAA